ncbi:methionine adenosyltransferase [Roseovarius indicus]|uniref:S-adenosylmethionine synthase n=1 Tax=Roseovarius indicus TaxID=540747 RepID=A0A0T5P4W1_9RHOB|nr:methionine adenosyltransferase [Roseovarius indicus]KRS16171.1 S-adenosylmethionine synthetase [Roseovarius indicus]OAO07734.1 methionine adenosyltransferase [Roseovarius indicus]QEW25013.1 S-adenosylmethionine synthase [Roseovarius indicus]SFE40095.1 methionine adenosyltransferase [Roseovarius indicus]
MSDKSWLFTSESVSEGHPDKVCDRISDAVLDAYLAADPQSRVACETLATTDHVTIAGEVRGPENVLKDVEQIARDAIKDIGYEQHGFSWKDAEIVCRLHAQSADIAMGVDEGDKGEEGAGDQGIMFGYACNETEELMPAPIQFAHKILRTMAEDRKSGKQPNFGPDAKSQVTLKYQNGKPVGIDTVVVSTQHAEGLSQDDVRKLVEPYITDCFKAEGWNLPSQDKIIVNPTGNFVIGGPDGDAGLTGRKIIVDTYGGAAPHGGGAFSGKDPTKVDRSAAYISRYMAKNVVAAGLAEKCQIQLAYAIGVPEPVALYVDTLGTGRVDETRLAATLREMVRLTPRGIRDHLDLLKPIYARTAAYGHFGRVPAEDGGFSWERTDLANELARTFGASAAAE